MKIIEVYQCDPTVDGQGGGVKYLQMLTQEIRKREDVKKFVFLGEGERKKKDGSFEFIPVVKDKCNYVLFVLKLFKFALNRNLLRGSVVHVHRLYFGLPFGLLKWWNGCHVVCSMHGRTFEVFKENKKGLSLRMALSVFKFVEKLSISMTDFLVPVSQDVVNSFIEKYPEFYNQNNHKLKILTSMADLTKFNKIENIKKKKVLCFVGRLSDVKDIPFLIKLVKDNISFFEKHDLQINIYGDGERKDELSSAIKSEGIEDFLVLKGVKDVNEISQVFNESLATIICSKHEAGPTVLVESIACGTPVISNAIGEVKSILKEGGLGILVDKNQTAYIAAISLVLKGFEFSSENASQLLMTRTPKYVCDEYFKIFNAVSITETNN